VKLLIVAVSIVAALVLQGCSVLDVRDRPWDPKGGRSLYEQIPNEDGAALVRCCGATPSKCQRHQTDRC
jgi:hypothetical protein